MARRSNAPKPNDNSRYVRPVLRRINSLRDAYQRATAEDMDGCDEAIGEIISLLRDPETKKAINDELRWRPRPADALQEIADARNLINAEAELGQCFGFKAREVKQYIKRVRKAGDGPPQPDIGSVDDLIRCINAFHEQTCQAMAVGDSRWTHWRAVRHARADADARVFALGVIIADTMRRPLFRLSYAVGVLGLRNEVT